MKFKVGDCVSVYLRFGETGTVKELKDGRYGVEFHNLPMTLWYDANELRVRTALLDRCEATTKAGLNHPAGQCKHRALPKQRFCKKHTQKEER